MKTISTCVVKLVDVVSPFMGNSRGTKMVAAHPNKAGRSFGEEVTSYRKPFLIQDFAITSERDVDRAVATLTGMGYSVTWEG